MNEFAGKKLGEVMAFCAVGIDTLERGGKALRERVTDEVIDNLLEEYRMQANNLHDAAEKGKVIVVAETKMKATGEKLKKMREVYVGDQWDNATELLEWSSFFHGAAAAHFSVIKGIAQANDNEELILLSEESQNMHLEFLDTIQSELEEVGQDKGK